MRRPARGVILAPFVLALLVLTIPITQAEPMVTPDVTIEPTPTPEPTYPPLEPVSTVWPGPEPVLYVPPSPSVKLRVGAPYFGRCPSPRISTDRRRGNSPDAQAYLRSRLNRYEYNCAWWIVLQESGWRPTALNRYGACGFPQSSPCEKMAAWIAAREPTCKPTRLPGLTVTWSCDWRLYPNRQLDWMIAYVKGRYGSFLGAAMFKFGWTDKDGRHAGHFWY